MEEELTAIRVKSKKALWQLEQDAVQNLSIACRGIRPGQELRASSES